MTYNFSERLQTALKRANKKPVDLAQSTGLSQALISQYLNEKQIAKNDKISLIAEALNVSESWLAGFTDEIGFFGVEEVNVPLYENPRNRIESIGQNLYLHIPLYESLSCGTGLFVNDHIVEYITLPESLLSTNKEYFCQYAVGDSMINENINEGDLLIFEKTSQINNGQIGCFCIDENVATCKKFYKDDLSAIITLQPANTKYAPIIVTVETMNFHIVGKLSLVINKRG